MTRSVVRYGALALIFAVVSTAEAQSQRIIEFSGRQWQVRGWSGGPGSGCFSDAADTVWVDAQGNLHLRLKKSKGFWCQAEVRSLTYASYGDHQFQVMTRLDQLDPSVVFGMFLYKDDDHELDIEFTDSFDATSNKGWFAVQGPGSEIAQRSFPVQMNGEYSTHNLRWQPDLVRFSSWHGHSDVPPAGNLMAEWTYAGSFNPSASDALVPMINLWVNNNGNPRRGEEVVIRSYRETPLR